MRSESGSRTDGWFDGATGSCLPHRLRAFLTKGRGGRYRARSMRARRLVSPTDQDGLMRPTRREAGAKIRYHNSSKPSTARADHRATVAKQPGVAAWSADTKRRKKLVRRK
jgi:hypothetical protein